MPIVDPDAVQKEVNEFDAAFNETDEEHEAADKAAAAKPDEAGEATKDQVEVDTVKPAEEDPLKPVDGQVVVPPATDGIDWKSKAEDFEAQLKKERQRTSSWDGRIKASNQKVKDLEKLVGELQAKLLAAPEKKDEDAEHEKTDAETIELFKKSFPEMADFADMMDRKMKKIPEPAKAEPKELDDESKPIDTQESTESAEHWPTIEKAHPDVHEIVNSGKLLTYINTQPSFIKDHLDEIYYAKNGKGSSLQVIDLITEFKTKTGWKVKPDTTVKDVEKDKEAKLNSMLETGDGSAGPKKEGPDKNDFAGTATEIGL